MGLNEYSVYIMTNPRHTTLYIGVTNNLRRRVAEHKTHAVPGFSDTYNTTKLVYYETTVDVREAIAREKQLKKWSRKKKVILIEMTNPSWSDLSSF